MPARTLLLTGASGVIGQALRPALAGHHTVALTHRVAVPGDSVHGDLTRPRLGLDPVSYRRLAARIDTIVHAGAVTDFTATEAVTDEVNIAGTAAVLQLARDAGARVVYVSTAFVARSDLTVAARGADVGAAAARPEAYLASKRAAEDLVRAADVPAVIARPSVVIGDSSTGVISRFQGLHALMAAGLRNMLPLVPLHPHTRVDVIPADIAAGAIAALAANPDITGEFWLTAGPAAPTASHMVQTMLEAAADLGIEVTAPRHVAPDMVARLVRPVFIDPLPTPLRRRFDDLMAVAALFADAPAFATSLGTIPGGPAAPDAAHMTAALRASVAYFAHAKNLVPHLAVAA